MTVMALVSATTGEFAFFHPQNLGSERYYATPVYAGAECSNNWLNKQGLIDRNGAIVTQVKLSSFVFVSRLQRPHPPASHPFEFSILQR
jgi:hypothetical protein